MIQTRFYANLTTKKKKDPYPLKIFWATDAHVYASVDGNPNAPSAIGGTRYFYTASQKLQYFVDDVNAVIPDLVYFSGDMIEEWKHIGSADLFMQKWNQISPNIRKELTIGNHDLAGFPQLANTEMADVFGYGGKPIIAGSKFNQSFYLDNGKNKVKVISFDSNIDEFGNHVVVTIQLMKQPIRDWIESEILNSTADIILICSHGGVADNSAHFSPSDQAAFKTMINNVVGIRPELKLYTFFGHNHILGVSEHKTLGKNIKAYSLPPVVDNSIGKYTVLSVSKDGVEFEIKDLAYPYN
jgi:hypothetical protein